jgi:hypothetical protein
MTCDHRCYNLAAVILQDEPHWFDQPLQVREETVAKLATLIQSTIEDWINQTRSNQ